MVRRLGCLARQVVDGEVCSGGGEKVDGAEGFTEAPCGGSSVVRREEASSRYRRAREVGVDVVQEVGMAGVRCKVMPMRGSS